MTMQRTTRRSKLSQWLSSGALCGALLWGATGAIPVGAQEPSITAAPAVASAKRLANEDLKALTENLGFEPTVQLEGDKISYIRCEWIDNNFRYVVYLSIPGNGNNLIVQFPLHQLPTDEGAYGKEMSALLSKAFALSPSYFALDDNRRLQMIRYVPNHELTPAKIRRVLSEMTEQVRNSSSVWSCDTWEPKATLVARPAIQPK